MTSYRLAALAAVSSANAALSLLETMAEVADEPDKSRPGTRETAPRHRKAVASQTAEPEAESWKF